MGLTSESKFYFRGVMVEELYVFFAICFIVYWVAVAYGFIGAMLGRGHEEVRKQKQPARIRMR